MYVWSEGRLRGDSNCWVWLGYEFQMSRSQKSFTKKLYAGVLAGDYLDEDSGKEFDDFPEQPEAQKGAQEILIRQVTSVLEEAGGESLETSS